MKRAAAIILSILSCFTLFTTGCKAPKTIDTTKPHIAISFSYNEGLRYSPSYAVWAEDESGNTATLYATGKAAANRWGGAERSSVLPIWSGVREANVDAVSSATPSKKAMIQFNIPEQFHGQKLKIFIEANASFDYNDYYKQGLRKGVEGYNDVNGQPSMLWVADLDPSPIRGEVAPVSVGSGDVLGADHAVHADLSNVTTAKELLKNITIKYDFIEP